MLEFKLLDWFGTFAGRATLMAVAIGSLAGLRYWDVTHQRGIGKKNEQVRVETVGKKIDAKAQQKRERVQNAPPSEVDAALRKYCRDCK